MMHSNGFVVTIRDAKTKKQFREHRHSREGLDSKAEILLPFSTEYELCFKQMNALGPRHRVLISIDGVDVGEWIITGDCSLERFKDVDKRFKFVRPDHEGVADPISSDNGKVEITVWREKSAALGSGWTYHRPYTPWWPQPWNGGQPCWPDFYTHSICYTSSDNSAKTLADSPMLMNAVGDAGATVEGGKSGQTFGTTTWNGDESVIPETFTFWLRGMPAGPASKYTVGSYCTECGEKLAEKSKFCHACGTKIKAA